MQGEGKCIMSDDPQTQDKERLERYLEVDAKLAMAPVPTPLDRQTALSFIQEHVNEKQSVDRMELLGRLAELHDLRGAARRFADCLNRNEYESDDFRRSVVALRTIARIGDDEQCGEAQRYFRRLRGRAKVPQYVEDMHTVCEAFGPREDTLHQRKWVEGELTNQRSQLEDHNKNNDEDQAEIVRNRIARLEEYLDGGIRRLELENATREKIDALAPPEARPAKLAELYVDATRQSSERLSYWAALRLVRLSAENPSLKGKIADRFLAVARSYAQKVDLERQQEWDTYRARCLRAVQFFGRELDAESLEWLNNQQDSGTDVLAKRPDWEY